MSSYHGDWACMYRQWNLSECLWGEGRSRFHDGEALHYFSVQFYFDFIVYYGFINLYLSCSYYFKSVWFNLYKVNSYMVKFIITSLNQSQKLLSGAISEMHLHIMSSVNMEMYLRNNLWQKKMFHWEMHGMYMKLFWR